MRRFFNARSLLAFVCFAALAAGYAGMAFSRLPAIFAAPEEDMDYAWWVPLFSAAVLWSERRKIAAAAGAPSFAGTLVCLPFLALGMLGTRGLQVRFELLGFAGLLVAVVWSFWGRKCAARVLFPCACLLFCTPMASYLSVFTVKLRLIASATAGGVLSLLFHDAVREGNLITLTETMLDGVPLTIDIANPCSGLRSIYALLAISVGYGYWTQPTWLRRALLAASAVPIAMAGNIARILSIGIVAKSTSASFATGFYHDFSGYVVFAVAIFLLLCANGAIDRLAAKKSGGAKEEDGSGGAADAPAEHAAAPCASGGRCLLLAPVATTLLVAGAAAVQTLAPPPVVMEPMPAAFPSIDGFETEQLEPSVAETNILRGAKVEKRLYKAKSPSLPEGMWFQATVVTSGPNKMSLHRPELCLPSQGGDILGREAFDADGVPWRIVRMGAKHGNPPWLFAYTMYNQELWRTSSHEARIARDVWDRAVLGRIDRWSMATVAYPASNERAFKALLRTLGGFADGGGK